MKTFPAHGLYAISQCEGKTIGQVIEDVTDAIRGGVKAVQYRDKNPKNAEYLAQELHKICNQNAIPFIVNDDVNLALKVKADGIHLGKNDGEIYHVRQVLGDEAIIGVSCYNSLETALIAQKNGATYVAFGRFFPSNSKPLASPADIQTLRQAKEVITIPIVAIGGILPDNGGQLLEAGADVLAVIGGIFDGDPEQSARSYQHLFND